MRCFIKDRFSFKTYLIYDTQDFDVCLETALDDTSAITLPTQEYIREGDILIADNGFKGLIKKKKPNASKKTVELTCTEILNLFDINLGWQNSWFVLNMEYSLTAYGEGGILNEIKTAADIVTQRIPYLKYKVYAHNCPLVDLGDNYDRGIFNLKDYLDQYRKERKVDFNFSVDRPSDDILRMNIDYRQETPRKIDFSKDQCILLSEDYANETISTYTCWRYDTEAEPWLVKTIWYIKTDGTITTTEPDLEDRIIGINKDLHVDTIDADEQQAIVEAEIAKVKYAHKIEFSEARRLKLYDPCEIRLRGRVFDSYITSVRSKDDNSSSFIYTSGELRTSLTEKIRS